jgi:inner membrane protein
MNEIQNTAPSAAGKVRSTVFSALKLVTLGVLTLLLLIPVASLLGLVRERQSRESEVRWEIANLWGDQQILGAAVLTLPLRKPVGDGLITWERHYLPEQAEWSGSLETEVRKRGIFEVPVYQARLTAQGRFAAPDLAAEGVDPDGVDWERASLTLGIRDLSGLQDRVTLRWGGTELRMVPGSDAPSLVENGLKVTLGEGAREMVLGGDPFRIDLAVRGTERLGFLPLGEVTEARLTADWADPGFDGASLPEERELSRDGFSARWSVPYFSRSYPQEWSARMSDDKALRLRNEAEESAFGVTLVRPADEYQQTERSVKYAILFIVLTFTTLFLLELLSSVRLHPMHYLLVGFALCLFYLVLLALAEHVGFLPAYLAASAAIVVLVTSYVASVLGSWRRTVPLAGTLAVLYGYLYGLLRAEDYSLLMGAAGLFVILALVMYLTRKLDWWTLSFRFPTSGQSPGS